MRIFGGIDPATGKQLILTGSAAAEVDAITLRDGFRKQIEDQTAVRTDVTLRVLLAEGLAGHQVESSTRAGYALLIDKFILPALGEQTLPALAKLGPRPYERLYTAPAGGAAPGSRLSNTGLRGGTSATSPMSAARSTHRRSTSLTRYSAAPTRPLSMGMYRVQPAGGRAEAAPPGAGPRPAHLRGSGPHRRCGVGGRS